MPHADVFEFFSLEKGRMQCASYSDLRKALPLPAPICSIGNRCRTGSGSQLLCSWLNAGVL